MSGASKFDPRDVFTSAETARTNFRIGTEVEKFGVFWHQPTQAWFALGYRPRHENISGARVQVPGITDVFDFLQRRGWTPSSEIQGGPTLMLTQNGASITLEPGAQFELSGAPFATLAETHAELMSHRKDLADFGEQRLSDRVHGGRMASNKIAWLGMGFHPFAKSSDLGFVPKLRYPVMREYLPTVCARGLDMMQRTSTVQVNLDYENEADAMTKLMVSLRIAPIVTALFASSPLYEGHARGLLSERADVWLRMDPYRSGLIPQLWQKPMEKLRYEDYIEWALDVPMFLVKRGKSIVRNTGQTFRDFLTHGFAGEHATLDDWQTHLNTLFPDARLKRTLELRAADAANVDGCVALGALAKGLLYNTEALGQLCELTAGWSYADVARARAQVPQHGLLATLGSRRLLPQAERLLEIAHAGLPEHERSYLAPLAEAVEKGGSLGTLRFGATPTLERVLAAGAF